MVKYEKPTVESLLKTIPSGIGLDIAKNHSGIFIWDNGKMEQYGFALDEYEKNDPFAEYKMRRQFKQKLSEIVRGRYFEHCIIEDVYAGENFDTVRKLLALNTVIDELIFERVLTINKFYRWNEPKWSKATRIIYKQKGRLKSKFETQGLLEYLEYDFLLEHKDDKPAKKKEIFFEDICDATAMLLAVVANESMLVNVVNSANIKMSDIKMIYVEGIMDTYSIKDKRVNEEGFIGVDLDYRNLEKSIIAQVTQFPNDVLCALLPSSKLGVFGMKHNFKFFDSDEGYLLFYKK